MNGQIAREDIMLNVDTMKHLFLIAKTPEGKKARKYFIEIENINHKVLQMEMEEHKLLQENTLKLLEETKTQLKHVTKLQAKKWANTEPGECVYAYKNETGIDNYKRLGKAESIKHREDSYMVGNRSSNIFYYKNCYNCKLTERVLHHVLDKYRVQNNKEWFDISDELAIYIIDIVCDFLDGFINTIELITESGIKESLSDIIIQLNKQKLNKEIGDIKQEEMVDEIHKVIKKEAKVKHVTLNLNYEENLHFDKFINEYCEVSVDNKCLKLELLGAYRLWNRKLYVNSRKNLTTYMKNHYESKTEFFRQYNTRLSFYMGLKPKNLNIKRESVSIFPVYEEFILSEYKFGYTYRTTKKNIINNFELWISNKHPMYNFTKQERLHMISYLHRTFLNCPKIHLNAGVDGYYGLQHKTDDSEINGILINKRKEILQIDINTQNTLNTFGSLSIASEVLNIDYVKLSDYVISHTVLDNSFFLRYK